MSGPTEFREYFDDTRQVVVRYADGTTITRAYTTAENTEADARVAAVSNETVLRTDARAQIDVLIASVDALKLITDKLNVDITPGDTKTVARETRRVARQVIRLTRLMLDVLDTTNTGTPDPA